MLRWLHRIPWPLPALLVWLGGWGCYLVLIQAGQGPGTAAVLISLAACLAARWGDRPGRRLLIGLGFPLSWLWQADWATLAAPLWLLPLAVLLLLYPPSAWRYRDRAAEIDFGALREHLLLAPMARILVIGQPLGPLLRALERAFPDARRVVLCASWADWLGARLSGSEANLQRADPWQSDWSACELLLLALADETQPSARPESAASIAAHKAAYELPPGAWLASLGQALPGCQPSLQWHCHQGGTLWLYQAPWPAAASGQP